MKPLHEELKEIRLKKNISLEDIYTATKIRPTILEKLEEGDFSVAPEPFIRAFLREYAEATGIDPDRVIARYANKSSIMLEEFQIERKALKKDTTATETVQNESVPEKKNIYEKEQPLKITSDDDKQTPGIEPAPEIVEKPETPSPAPEGFPEIQSSSSAAHIDNDKPDPSVENRNETVHEYSSGLDIEKPRSFQGLLFGIFIVLIVIATLIIIYVNGGFH